MANIDGLPVNSAVTHAEFMSRTQDTSTVSKIGLLDPDVASGASISNVQKAINKAFEGIGTTGESDTAINDYASNNYILDGDDRKEAIEKLDAQLGTTQTQLDALDLINSEDVSIVAIGSTPNANGSTITGQVLNLEPANASFGGVVTTGAQTFAGDKTFQNNVVVTGDLTVNGTTTTVNSTTVSTVDKNITISQGGNDAASEGAGLTVDRTSTDGSFIYKDASATKWAAGSLGSEVDLVGTTSTQTLTNKTIDGASNTITNISSGALTGTVSIASGGTGQTTQTAAFDALSPLTTKGDLIVNDGTNDIRLAVGTNTHVLTADSTQASGVKWAAVTGGSSTTPTIQRFTSGSGTYTTPVGVTYLRVKLVGGGGGGASTGTSGTFAGVGGNNSTFGTSLLTAGSGGGGQIGGGGFAGGSGGTTTVNSPAISVVQVDGATGGAPSGAYAAQIAGGAGGASFFGGAGGPSTGSLAGRNAAANSGSGGSGSGSGPSVTGGAGGGSGAYIEAIINSPSASYAYIVGAGGNGGAAGVSGFVGGNGGSGVVIVEEYY